MKNTPTGLHHITSIASDPQQNVDFYAGLLGLRLVKKTVNFDDPSAYHLYYGDETGTPGSIVTFFYWPGLEARGRLGTGQNTAIVFSAPAGSLDFWQQRLQGNAVAAERRTRFGEDVVAFADPDGIPVEIVAVADDARTGWLGNGIAAEHALRGLHTAQLTVRVALPTEKLITDTMGYHLVSREGNRARFEAAAGGGSGHYIDVIADDSVAPGFGGAGTIHHIAWSVPDDATQLVMQNHLHAAGYHVSDVRDRNYFNSIYYRERGGILFEIATATPGFPVDEPVETLGTALKLPAQFERARAQLERLLPPLQPARRYV
ncbi:MAG TPA: ring-cleaving dioxygenase [Rariglobus sp.]|jgi:glyoxalase family protein|nr:ring-cleaving dioxygenase [Rariglobus sp.]